MTTLILVTNRTRRTINLHPSFFDKIDLKGPDLNEKLELKVKPLVKDLALGEKIRHVTIDHGGDILYNFSSSLPKDFERHNPLASEPPLQRGFGSFQARGGHLQKAGKDRGKINFLRS